LSKLLNPTDEISTVFEVTLQIDESGYESIPNAVAVERIDERMYKIRATNGWSETFENAVITSVEES
jgi:hypothetical protein